MTDCRLSRRDYLSATETETRPERTDRIRFRNAGSGVSMLETEAIYDAMEAQQRRVEQAIRGAVRAGFDGVDINYPTNMSRATPVIRVEPWHYPSPEDANGCRTERYTWDWFAEDELAALLASDDPRELLADSSQSRSDTE